MSPVPLIARQRALSRIGEIRLGDEKHDGKVGRKLETFRLTSQHKEILERAAELYGGTVKPWESPTGEAWQVITTRSSLPVLVIPGYSLRRSYEKWAGPSKRERVCDGEEETISGEPCICNAQGRDECKLLTRLMVLLPETGTSLGWQLSSTGETAADELDLAMKIAEGIAQGRPFVPGTLSITQRKGQLEGKATRFVVPVLGFDPQQQLVAGELPAGRALPQALPAGYTPIEQTSGNGATLAEGLKAAETQTLAKKPRVQLPDDDVDDEDPGAPSPLTTPEPQVPTLEEDLVALNALVGQLRESGAITTKQIWRAVARMRKLLTDGMIELLCGELLADDDLHWSPLRDSLDAKEAAELRRRLGKKWAEEQAKVQA